MSEKPLSERVGVNEEKLRDHHVRIKSLEDDNEKRKNAIVRAMWWCIRLLLTVTFLTFISDKMREKWEPIIRMLGL